MTLFPVFLHLTGRRVLVVGGGAVALSKLDALLEAGANVTLVAPEIHSNIGERPIVIHRRTFTSSDLDGVFFVVAAASPDVNREVVSFAETRGLFVNAVDDVRNATAFLGGVVRKGGVTLAVSTDGRAPALAGLIREALERLLPGEEEGWSALAERLRLDWKREGLPMPSRRPALLKALIEKYEERQ